MVCTESVWLFLNWMPITVLKRVCDVFVSSHNLLINLIKSFESCITGRSIMTLCVCFSSLLVFLSSMYLVDMSQIMRKTCFCIYENKGADQLCSYCAMVSTYVFTIWKVLSL